MMETLLDLLNLPPTLAEVTVTSDGYYMARADGDCGFNVFLGKPSLHPGPGQDRTRAQWRKLSKSERAGVRKLAAARGVNLATFGI